MPPNQRLSKALEFCAKNGLWEAHAQLITSAVWQPEQLPALFERITQEETARQTSKPFAESRILIVEDEQGIAEILEEIVERLSDSCTVAHDGWEAVMELGNNSPFDLIITDLRLPKVGGRKLA